jgi:hypothetical protein
MIPLPPLTAAWAALVPLAQDIPDPDDVKPGWLGFVVVAGLAAAVVLLLFSFRKQLRKVRFDEPRDKGAVNADHGPAGSGDGVDHEGSGPEGPRAP